MYTHNNYKGLGINDLFYNGFPIGAFSRVNGIYFLTLTNMKTYQFETLHDMFTALRMLKDICE